MTAGRWSTAEPVFTEDVEGSARPAAYYLAESRDGLYLPYVVRTPADEGRFPFVFLAYGNGGGGIGWLRQRVHTRPYIMERLLAAGYACGWGRYRTEVDLGFNRGGPLMVDGRQGMEVMNRSPLEFEDEVAILEHVRRHPQVDAGNLGHIGVSHAGEMLFKLAFRYPGMLRAGVASEPANHEFLDLRLGDAAPVNPETGLRDIEEMQLQDPAWVRPAPTSRWPASASHRSTCRSSSWGGTATISRGSSASATSYSTRAARTPSGCPGIIRCTATSSRWQPTAPVPTRSRNARLTGSSPSWTGT